MGAHALQRGLQRGGRAQRPVELEPLAGADELGGDDVAAYPTTVRAFSAAQAPIELKSSIPAEVGIEPAPAGATASGTR